MQRPKNKPLCACVCPRLCRGLELPSTTQGRLRGARGLGCPALPSACRSQSSPTSIRVMGGRRLWWGRPSSKPASPTMGALRLRRKRSSSPGGPPRMCRPLLTFSELIGFLGCADRRLRQEGEACWAARLPIYLAAFMKFCLHSCILLTSITVASDAPAEVNYDFSYVEIVRTSCLPPEKMTSTAILSSSRS